jgi:RHS repeat-associated protein
VLAQTAQVVEYYHTDALGSVRAVTKAGVVVSRHDFMPFGEELEPTIPPPDKRLFTGKERNAETATDHFEARYLTTGVARFVTVDPVIVRGERLFDPQ